MSGIRVIPVTLRPVGSDGAAVATKLIGGLRGGFLRAISIDYQNQPVTTDIVVYDGDDALTGVAMFTNTSSNTDIPAKVVESENAVTEDNTAATANGGHCGVPFVNNIFIGLAQGDGQTSGNEAVVMKLWVEV